MGIEFKQQSDGSLILSQSKYIRDLFTEDKSDKSSSYFLSYDGKLQADQDKVILLF